MKSSNYDSLMQIMGKKRKNLQDIKEQDLERKKEVVISYDPEKSILSNPSPTNFSYKSLNDNTLEKALKEKEIALKSIFSSAYTQMGKTLKEAQELLSNHDKTKGVFEAWYSSLGFKKDSVYRLISRFNLLANCEEKEKNIIESIPLSLAYEISKNSCPSLLKEEVLEGNINSLKEFKKNLRELIEKENIDPKKQKYLGMKEIQKEEKELKTILDKINKKDRIKDLEEADLIEVFYLIRISKNKLKKILKILELNMKDPL